MSVTVHAPPKASRAIFIIKRQCTRLANLNESAMQMIESPPPDAWTAAA